MALVEVDSTGLAPLNGPSSPLEQVEHELRRVRATMPAVDWNALCVDVLVHAADADAGALLDEKGDILAAVGLGDAEVSAVSRWSLGTAALPHSGAWARYAGRHPEGDAQPPRLALLWKETRASLSAGAGAVSTGELSTLVLSLWTRP